METEAGTAEGIRHTAPSESVFVKLLAAWAAWAREGTKRRPNQVCTFVEYPKTGTARSSEPAPYRAAWSLSSVDGESTLAVSRGKPSVARTASAPHTRQWDLSAAPLPPHSTTEQVCPLVSGQKLDTEEASKQKPNKQRELLQKWSVQQIKIPIVNTDYTRRGL